MPPGMGSRGCLRIQVIIGNGQQTSPQIAPLTENTDLFPDLGPVGRDRTGGYLQPGGDLLRTKTVANESRHAQFPRGQVEARRIQRRGESVHQLTDLFVQTLQPDDLFGMVRPVAHGRDERFEDAVNIVHDTRGKGTAVSRPMAAQSG